jgi:hypothetical protein
LPIELPGVPSVDEEVVVLLFDRVDGCSRVVCGFFVGVAAQLLQMSNGFSP